MRPEGIGLPSMETEPEIAWRGRLSDAPPQPARFNIKSATADAEASWRYTHDPE